MDVTHIESIDEQQGKTGQVDDVVQVGDPNFCKVEPDTGEDADPEQVQQEEEGVGSPEEGVEEAYREPGVVVETTTLAPILVAAI